jgi:hypothetical protein
MKTVTDIISLLGSNAEVASGLDVGQSTVSEFKRRNSIPVKYWPKLIGLAHAKNVQITNDILVEVHAGEAAG